MKSNTQKGPSQVTYQLMLPLHVEILIPKHDSVRLLSQVMEELDYTNLYKAYSRKGRKPAVSPKKLFKIIVYDEEADEYTCPNHKKLKPVGMKTRKSKSGYKSDITVYECENCSDCQYKASCTRAKGNRQMKVSKNFQVQRENSFGNITSNQGILLRINRSIQVEGETFFIA